MRQAILGRTNQLMNPKDFKNKWHDHPIFRAIDQIGFVTTIDGGRIAPDVNPDNIAGNTVIRVNSLLQGPATVVKGSTVVENSYCRDTAIEDKATVKDSILISTGHPRSHQCDSAGRYIVQSGDVHIGSDSQITHSNLTNAIVNKDCRIENSTLLDCRIGPANVISQAKMTLTHTEPAVRLDGPTEISEAWLGRKTHIHKQGYFEGVFSNEFAVLEFDEQSGQLVVREVLDIPHVSQYGTNTINSTNSGRLLPQPDMVMKDFGPHVGLWYDPLLSHEPILLGPCCWVSPWTKVIGKSAQVYQNPLDTVLDRLHTYLMPFSMAGYGGHSTLGLVSPGEKSNGYGNKQRSGAWVFTNCPDAVVRMVWRLYEALDDDEKHKADIVAEASLKNALCLLKYQARQLNLDLDEGRDRQRGSQAKWFWDTKNLLEAHINADVWVFKNGKPAGWTQKGRKWHHVKLDEIRSADFSKDRELDISEDQLLAEPSEETFHKVHLENALRPDDLAQTTVTAGSIDHSAQIHSSATIDRSARIGPAVKIDADAYIGPGTLLEGRTVIGTGSHLFRTVLRNTETGQGVRLSRCVATGSSERSCVIGSDVKLTGCKILSSEIGDRSAGVDAKVINSTLAADTTIDMFAVVDNVCATKPTIIGGTMIDCRINTVLMSMHSAGCISGLVAEPVTIEVDGEKIEIPAIPMLGGGCQIHGSGVESKAVLMEGAFIGSNAIIEAGSFVGLGSFVLGQLGPNEGLLPFTVSTQPGPETDVIGAVLTRSSNLVITHFISWTYQALPKEGGNPANVVHLVRGGIKQSISAILYELDRRQKGLPWGPNEDFAKYKSLPLYSQEQLNKGLLIYERCLGQGCWELVFDGSNLSFANAKGFWAEKNGHVCWQKGKSYPV